VASKRRALRAPELTKRYVERTLTRLIRMTCRRKQNYGWTHISWIEEEAPDMAFELRNAVLLVAALWREVGRLKAELKEAKKGAKAGRGKSA
jgi:hypothetical protein